MVQLHPEKSRDKLRFLLQPKDAGGACGTCMIFYDVTDLTTEPSSHPAGGDVPLPRRLFKIPVYRKNRVILIDLKDIVRFQGDGHYTTIVTKDERYLSNLSLADLELRLDSSIYLRVHRSHIVSLQYAVELVKLDASVNLVMDDAEQTQVPVSRSRTAQLKELLGVV